MSRLSMKDGRIVLDEQNEKPNSTTQKTSASNSRLSMVDGRIVLADKPVAKAANNQQYLQKTQAAQREYQAMDDVLPQRNNVMDMAINSLRNRVANSSVGRSMGDWAKNAAETYTNHKQIKDWLRNTPEGQKYLIDYNKSEEERQKAKEIKRQQDAITLAQDIDVASSLYEPPTKRELVKVKDTNMDNADMFSNDWEPVAGDEHEEWRTVQNERYNPLAREERDALIDSYYKAMMGGVDSETYHQIMVDVAQNGGIQQLVAEQKADAESDRNYLAKLNYGINLDDMSLLQRAGKTAGNLLSGTEKQWLGQQMAGIETMVTPPEAMSAKAQTETFQADRDKVRDAAWDYVSALVGRRLGGVNEQEVSAARNALNSTVMGDYYLADETYDPNLEMGDPRNAAWLRVADQLNAVADRIAEGDSSITKDNILDFIQGGNLSEQVKKAFNDDQFQAAYENLLRGGAEDLDLAKAYNPIAGGFGDMVIDAASSSLSSAQSVLLSRMLLGGAISGVSNLQTRVIDKLAKSGAAKFLVNGAGFVGNRIQDILGMAAFGTGAYGASANEARQKMLEQGIDIGLEEARKIKQYAAANTGIEFGSEMLFSSIGAIKNASGSSIFNGFADEFGEALSGFVSTPRGKAVVGTIGKLIGGGVEEGLEEVIGDFVRDVCDVGGLVGDENKTTFEEYLKDFLVGAMSGLMGEVTSTVYSPLQRENIGKQVKAGEATLSDGTKLTVQDMVNLANSEGMEGTTLAKTYNDLFKGLPRSIDSFTNKEVGRLYEAYEETLGKSEEAINRVQDTLDKFESGEELRRSDINKITNNADAVRYLQSAAGTELNLDGSITERKAAVEDALRAIASQNETLREALTENVSPDAENANMGDLEDRINALPIMNRQAMPNEIASGYFQDSTRDTVRNAAQQMGIGEEGQNIMAGLYSGNRENAIDYVGEMTKYYNQGKENKELNFEEIAGNNLANDQQSLAAWRAGRADYLADMARRETNNERAEGQADLLRDGTERMDGENSVRESAAVGEVAGGAEVRQTGFQQRGTGAERVYSGSKVGARLTESQLNARDIAAAGYNVVTGNNDVEANNVKNYVTTRAAKNGINVRDVILFRGAMLDVNGARERGFFIYHPDGSVTIAAQLDNEDATGEQIATHEFTHALIKKMSVDLGKATKDVIGDLGESGEVSFGTIRDYMAKELGGQDRLVQAVNAYAAVYKAAGAIQADENGNVSAEDMRMVFEEMICDFVAGMNAFAEVGHVSQAVRSTPVMAAAKKAVEKMANETRGSPSATEINNGYTARAMEETVDNPVKASISIADAVAERSVAAVPKDMEEYDYYLKLLSSPDNREIPIKYRDTDATGDNGEIVPDAETTDISVQQQYGTGGEESQSLKTGNPVAQAISSADTSLNQVPALHKDSRVEWGKTNIDIGAGAYEAATEYLKEKGVTNLKWDPYNQSKEVNRATLKYLQDGNKADTATNANVLNVIAEKDARLNVVLQAAKSIKPDGKAYFMVYEGDGSGIGRRTSKGWQNNLKTKEYADEIRTYFNDVQVKGKLIVASNPKANLPMASWEVTPGNAVKFSTSLSSAYMAAAKRGDTETAQRLVDEAAEEAMPNSEIRNKNGKLLKVYHGTDADFNVFDTTVSGGKNGRAEGFGIYLSPDQEVTKSYGDRQIGMFANITKPAYSNRKTISVTKLKALLKSTCEAEAKEMAEDYGGSVKDALKDTWISNYVDTYSNSMEIAYTKAAQDILRMNGSDMEVIQEVMAGMAIREYADAIAFYNDHLTPVTGFDGFWTEWTNRETGKKTPVILAFNSNQLKVADAITRNDDGDIIPLEERFNPKNDDIRFSRDLSNTELYEANRQLQKDLTELRSKLKTRTEQRDYWRGQTRVTEGRKLRIDDVTKLAREIIKGQDSSADAKAVAEKLKALGEYILNSQDENVYDEARLKAYEIAHDILTNAKMLNTKGGDDFYSDFRTALKNQPIYVSPSVRAEVAPDGWNDFRKAQFGTINMTADQNKGKSVDKVYHDLQATFGEWLLPEYIVSEADQLNKILEVIETYRPVYENLNSYEMADAVEWTANEILTRIIGEEIRETNPTYADRMEKKLSDQKVKSQEALRRVREQRDRKVADLKEHYQQVAEDRRNRKIDSEMRSRLLKIAKRLNNKKLDRVTRGLLDQYIGELDLVSKGILGRTVKELETLQAWYDSYKESMGDDFIPDKFIERKIARLSKKHISDLTQEEVADLTTVLLNLETMIRTQNQLIESQIKMDAYAAGVQTIDDINNSNGKTGFLNKFISTETATPEREIHRITGYREDSPLYKAAKELSDGQRNMLDYQRRAEALFKKWTTEKKFIRRIAGKHAEEIVVSGYVNGELTNVKITPAMRMALYLHEKNDDNMRHISKGGVKIPDMALYKKGKLQEAYDKATRVVFTRGMLKEIASKMSADEKAFADAVDRYYNGMSRNEINDTSEALRGYAIAGVEHYYPIDTDGAFLKKEFDAIKRDGSIEGMGILKERIEGATNPIMLYDMNDTLNRSISQHSKYVGLAIPVRNFNKLYSVTTFNYETSVAETLKKNWGSAATSYIEKMMADVQNGTGLKSDAWGDLLARARSHYAGAVLNTNASVALKQAASYPTAAAVVGYGPLAKALADTKKIDLEKLAQYTPLLWYRSKGFSTTELGDIGKEGGHIPAALNWIQAIDVATTTKLVKAAMYYVNENNKSLVRGSDTWWKEVANVYNRIIEETQPNYTMMQRPQILRSDNALTRALNMFKTQPFQNFNILYDAFGNLSAKSREYKANATTENLQALKSARTNAARAVSSQVVSAFVFALMQFAWDAFRGKDKKYKDDDDEMALASWLKGMGINVLSSVGGMIPFGSYVLELGETLTDTVIKAFGGQAFFDQKFYGLSENAAESVNDMGNALINMVTKAAQALEGGEVTESTVRSVVDSMADVAQFAGIPVNNVIKLAQAIARNAFLATDGKYIGGYKALRVTTDPARYPSDYYDLLWRAYNNDQTAYQEVLQMMLDDGSGIFTEEKIKSNMEKRMKTSQGVSSVKDLESRWMAPAQQQTYDKGLADLEQTTMFQAATDEQQQALITRLYNLALDNEAGKKLSAKIAGGANVGLDQTEYLLYTLALSMADQPTESGKYGSYTNDEVEAAILMVPGLSKQERAYLWEAAGKTQKSNPWR